MCLLSDFQNNVIIHRYRVNKLPIINPITPVIIMSSLLYIFISPFIIKYKFYVVLLFYHILLNMSNCYWFCSSCIFTLTSISPNKYSHIKSIDA